VSIADDLAGRAVEVEVMAMTGSPVAALRAASRSLDRRVAATPAGRDRTVDLMRAVSIAVVVIWHWAGSVTHRRDGEIVMPNPIDQVPLLWLATWVGQVMPVFFLVGGFANLAAWERTGGSARAFLRLRLARLLRPTAVFLGVWAVLEVVLLAVVPGYPGVVSYGRAVAAPLWFLAAYLWVVLLIPVTAVAHRRAAVPTVALLGTAVVAADLARFGAGLEVFGLVNTALVWVFVHQLGYLWRDGMLDSPDRRWTLAAAGVIGLVVVAALPIYPRSMVATVGGRLSHMYPTTVGIAMLAVFQLGVIVLLRPALSSWLHRRRVWKIVVAANTVIMTVFLWHMTALVAALTLFETVRLPIYPEPTAAWWAQRPLWLLVPAVLLAALVALFARAETHHR
jgi:peptidoglycan/LPS O-acetylase OafA/YrhL